MRPVLSAFLSRRPLGAGLLALLLLAGGCARTPELGEQAGPWPQFRGPGGQGVSPEVDLPERWRPNSKNLRWKVRIPGQGDSSPVVSGGRVFITTAYSSPTDTREDTKIKGHLQRVVMALDLETGEVLWETPIFAGPVGKIHWLNSYATPTPAADGKTLFVSFDSHLAALDYDGNLLWKKDLEPEFVTYSHYGAASSPVVARKTVFLLQDREEGDAPDSGWLVAFDKKTGEELWRDEWNNTCCSYTTPVLIEKDRRQVLLVSTSHEANAYDPDSGERLWQVNHRNIQPVPSVAVWEDYVTFPGAIHDALLSTFVLGDPEAEPEFLWATRRAVPDIPSPVYYQGRLFTLSSSGVLSNRDPATGKSSWQKRLPSSNYRAALIAGDGKLYAVNDLGKTAVIDATLQRYKLIRENELGEGSGATPAIADGCLLIRGADHLFCIQKERPAKKQRDAATAES